MNIGFDFDGFIVEDTEAFYQALMSMKIGKQLRERLCDWELINNSKPLYNPLDFIMSYYKTDRAYCISYCQRVETANRKDSYLRHYFGDRITFIPIVEDELDSDVVIRRGLCYAIAVRKVDVLLANNIEVYFDNNLAIVDAMRDLVPNYVKIIKCGRNTQ